MNCFGKKTHFHGEVVTLKIFEDNTLVRNALEENGKGKVLVIDGGGSLRAALVGGNLGKLAEQNLWEGIIVYGAIRDVAEISEQNIGIKCLGTNPTKTIKRNEGQLSIPIKFGAVNFTPGYFVYSDEDGIVVSPRKLSI
jgi:regulator of ribonuclease activity A